MKHLWRVFVLWLIGLKQRLWKPEVPPQKELTDDEKIAKARKDFEAYQKNYNATLVQQEAHSDGLKGKIEVLTRKVNELDVRIETHKSSGKMDRAKELAQEYMANRELLDAYNVDYNETIAAYKEAKANKNAKFAKRQHQIDAMEAKLRRIRLAQEQARLAEEEADEGSAGSLSSLSADLDARHYEAKGRKRAAAARGNPNFDWLTGMQNVSGEDALAEFERLKKGGNFASPPPSHDDHDHERMRTRS